MLLAMICLGNSLNNQMICTKSYKNFHSVQSYLPDYLFHFRKLTHKEVNKTLRLLSLLCPRSDLPTQAKCLEAKLAESGRAGSCQSIRNLEPRVTKASEILLRLIFWFLTLIRKEEEGRPKAFKTFTLEMLGCLGKVARSRALEPDRPPGSSLPLPLGVSLWALAGEQKAGPNYGPNGITGN